MINIVIPMAGPSVYFENSNFQYPKPLLEIDGKTVIERVVDYLSVINEEVRFIFIINEAEIEKYHLESTIKLIAGENSVVISQNNNTNGAVCTVLLAIEYINNEDTLIISNSDQVIEYDLNKVIDDFRKREADAGAICFQSVHPKWSYVKTDRDDPRNVIEVAEKKPISRNAIAGFYYYKHGTDYVENAMEIIKKNDAVNGLFYVSHTFNEIILKNKKVAMYKIDNDSYFSFYLPEKIKEYEAILKKRRDK